MRPLRALRGRLRARRLLPVPSLSVAILVAMLLPTLGVIRFTTITVNDRREQAATSAEVADSATALATTSEVFSALTDDALDANVQALARDLGVEPDAVETVDPDRLRASRERLDVYAETAPADVGALVDDIVALRTRTAAGTATFAEVQATYLPLTDALSELRDAELAELARIRGSVTLPRSIVARLDVVQAVSFALMTAGGQTELLVELLFVDPREAAALELLSLQTRYDDALERGVDGASDSVRDDIRALQTSAEATRIATLIRAAILIGFGGAADPISDPADVVDALNDASRWITSLNDLLSESASDLHVTADARAASDRSAAQRTIAAVIGLVLVALALAAGTTRSLLRAAREVLGATHRIEQGEFAGTEIEEHGPREARAVVKAFNDMTATLASVERQAVALADHPDSADVGPPLPGTTGAALQAALDRLRASIAEAELHRQALYDAATHDPLTGLLNRATADEASTRSLAQAARGGPRIAALFIDLDGLKQINDGHGHDAGDLAIERTGDALRASTREGDVVARLGGDEFLVLAQLTSDDVEAEAMSLAERVRMTIATTEVTLPDGHPILLRCSIGVAISMRDDSPDTLIGAADDAMYAAKDAGRNQVRLRRRTIPA